MKKTEKKNFIKYLKANNTSKRVNDCIKALEKAWK